MHGQQVCDKVFSKVLTIADFAQALPSGKTPKDAFQNVLNKSIPNNATTEYLATARRILG